MVLLLGVMLVLVLVARSLRVWMLLSTSRFVVLMARFLQLFDTNPSLLPKWWTAAKAEECIKLGQDDQGWSSLRHSLTKADVIEHYGDKQFSVQLRLFGEQVYGTPPADTP